MATFAGESQDIKVGENYWILACLKRDMYIQVTSIFTSLVLFLRNWSSSSKLTKRQAELFIIILYYPFNVNGSSNNGQLLFLIL